MLYVLEIKNPLQTLKLFGPSASQRAAAVGCFMEEGDWEPRVTATVAWLSLFHPGAAPHGTQTARTVQVLCP